MVHCEPKELTGLAMPFSNLEVFNAAATCTCTRQSGNKACREKTKTVVCKLLKSEDQKEKPHSQEVGALWARLQRFTTYFKPAQSHRYALQIIQIISNAMPPCK